MLLECEKRFTAESVMCKEKLDLLHKVMKTVIALLQNCGIKQLVVVYSELGE